MHKSATKCNKTVGKWCKNKHGASKIIDTLETYHEAIHTRCVSRPYLHKPTMHLMIMDHNPWYRDMWRNNKNNTTTIKSIQDGIAKHAPMLRGSLELELGIFIPLPSFEPTPSTRSWCMYAKIVYLSRKSEMMGSNLEYVHFLNLSLSTMPL
jgi:hypothetical protein